MTNNDSIDKKYAELDSFDGLRGNELLEKNEELKEEDYSLQDRIYECGYTLNGEPSYKHYFKALEEAKGTTVEDIFFEHFSESEVPFIIFEVAKQLKVMYFYADLIDELNNKNIEFFKAFKIIKNIELRVNYKDLYKTGFIKDNKNIDQDREIIKGQDLIEKITNSDGSMNYDSWLITECGYELFDKDDNESADALSFFLEVVKTKNFNLESIDLNDFDIDQFIADIEDIFNTDRKYYAFDFTCFDNDDELEIFALTENIQFEVVFTNSKEDNKSDINSQEFRPVEKPNNSINEKNNYLPPGKYWIGDLSYVMENYFEKHYCLVKNGVYQTENGINFARLSTAYGDGFFYDYEGNEYGVDTANIGCISINGISDEADDELGNYHIFDYPFQCVWNKIGGYIQYGDIWIQTDSLDQFILPPHIFTLKGQALLLFGEKFLKNDKCLPEIKNKDANHWIKKSRGQSYEDIVDRTVKEIYLIKSKIISNEYDPKRSFSCLVDNHGTSQIAEAFSRIFKDIFDIERDEERSKIISFLDSEVLDELQKTEYKITEVSSLNLYENAEIKAYEYNKKIESFLLQVGSNLRKKLWPEGKEASSWWEEHAANKEKNGDIDYASVARLIAKFHTKEISGDKVFTESSKLSKEIQYRIYLDMVLNCKWFFEVDSD